MIWTLENQTTNIEVQEKNTNGSKHGGYGLESRGGGGVWVRVPGGRYGLESRID